MSASSPGTGLAVVVVNYGSPALLETYLRPTAPPGSTVVVVDNPSTAEARTAVTAMAHRYGWDLVLSAENDGFGAGVNRGVARALDLGCDRFLLLNPDCGASPEVVAALDAYVLEHRLTFTSARVMMPGVTRPWFVGYRLDPRTGFSRRDPELGAGTDSWGWLTTPCVVVHRELWERVGGFDPEYFLYWEDVDLCRRMVDAGGSLAVLQDLEAVHDVGGTQEGTGKSPLYCYYTSRNRLLFASRHLGPRDQLRWLVRAPAAAVQIVLRSGPRQALRTPRTSWSALRGTLAGATIVVRGLVARRRQARATR